MRPQQQPSAQPLPSLTVDNGPGRPALAEIGRLAFLNAAFQTGIENPLEAAILAAGKRAGLSTSGFTKIDEIPYDFRRRRLTVVAVEDAAPGRHLMVTKGVFANVLGICVATQGDGKDVPLDSERRVALEALCAAKGRGSFSRSGARGSHHGRPRRG